MTPAGPADRERGAALAAQHLRELAETAARTADELADAIAAVADVAAAALQHGNKLLFCGNGGSAADAQHLATEYVVRYRADRRPLPALALTTDTSLLTAAANDLGFEQVFARQVAALGAPGDVLFLHSTSGASPNLIAAADAARARGIVTVGMLARDGGPLRGHVDHAIIVATDSGAHAQELHLAVGHIICHIVEERLAAQPAGAAGTVAGIAGGAAGGTVGAATRGTVATATSAADNGAADEGAADEGAADDAAADEGAVDTADRAQ
jgi:D-sedoheptulose 7-phosphate isomerase